MIEVKYLLDWVQETTQSIKQGIKIKQRNLLLVQIKKYFDIYFSFN